ncbi:MAG: hypothetical protein ACLTFJ_12965 [Clostridium sp.]
MPGIFKTGGTSRKAVCIFTNNSSKSPRTYIDKLAKMDCHIRQDRSLHPAM